MANVLVFPCFYMLLNPPPLAIGEDEDHPDPEFWYFILVAAILNIG